MKIGIVGTGPSANGKGQEIDSCDYVVRLHKAVSHGPIDAGVKTSALACHCADNWEIPPYAVGAPLDIWFTMAPEFLSVVPGKQEKAGDLWWLLKMAGGRSVRFASAASCEMVSVKLNEMSSRESHAYLSHGLVAISMALDTHPDVIQLFGFDRISEEGPTAQWASGEEEYTEGNDWHPHDWEAEKKLISELQLNKWWCGKEVHTNLIQTT